MDHKITRSTNQGPGDLIGTEAKRIRNSLSNTQNKKKKLKLTAAGSANAGLAATQICEELMGTGGISAAYVNGRHKFGPRGRVIGEDTMKGMRKAGLGGAQQAGDEATVRSLEKYDKYNVGPGQEIGMNNSKKKYTISQCATIGLKSAITRQIQPARGQRLATLGVAMLDMVENELQSQANQDWLAQATAATAAGNPVPPAPGPPSQDELKATVMLCLHLAHVNRNLPPQNRHAVDSNIHEAP